MSRQALIRRFLKAESGATAIEYGLIVAIITVFVIGIAATGGALSLLYLKMSAIATAMF